MPDRPAGEFPDSPERMQELLARGGYIAGRELATVSWLALRMHRPLLLEGEAGVGKTEIAKVLASVLGRDLIRLQCYEGLDLASAAYEWNYPRQMVAIRLAEAEGSAASVSDTLYERDFLVARPLLRALEPHASGSPVLLIDEVDRADEPFEAFLLEFLSDYQVSIPEFGVVEAAEPPIVVITSNRTREVHDALRRRCLYHWVDYPDFATESRIVALKAPEAGEELRQQVVAFAQGLRKQDLYKRPGVAETIDWANALAELDAAELRPEVVSETLGLLLKYQDDIGGIQGGGPIAGGNTGGSMTQGSRGEIPVSELEYGRLAGSILLFCRTLRAGGLPIGPGQVLDALSAVRETGIERPDEFYWALRATLVTDPAHYSLFRQAFHVWFRRPGLLARLGKLLSPDEEEDGTTGSYVKQLLDGALPHGEKVSRSALVDADRSKSWSRAVEAQGLRANDAGRAKRGEVVAAGRNRAIEGDPQPAIQSQRQRGAL